MSAESFDWARWLSRLQQTRDGVSGQVVGKWTQWIADLKRSEGTDGAEGWGHAIPPTITALSSAIRQFKDWISGSESAPEGVDIEALTQRVQVLEGELQRLKAKLSERAGASQDDE